MQAITNMADNSIKNNLDKICLIGTGAIVYMILSQFGQLNKLTTTLLYTGLSGGVIAGGIGCLATIDLGNLIDNNKQILRMVLAGFLIFIGITTTGISITEILKIYDANDQTIGFTLFCGAMFLLPGIIASILLIKINN